MNTMSVDERSRRRRRITISVWIVSALLVIAGVILIIVGLHGPRVGPSLPAPVGKTTAPPLGSGPSGVELASQGEPESLSNPAFTTAALRSIPSSMGPAGWVESNAWSSSGVSSPQGAQTSTLSSKNGRLDAGTTTTTFARSVPIHLVVPSLGISVRLTELGLTASGAVQLPSSFSVPGWYDEGYAPGQIGSAVILGHVDSVSGPGVFYRLLDMKVGQKVQVSLADGQSLTFKVIGLRQYAKNHFPLTLIYGPKSYSALNLVTCGGAFDTTTHHYLSNIVVFTKLASNS